MGVFSEVPLTAARTFFADYEFGELEALEGVPAGSVNSNFRAVFAEKTRFLRVYEEQDFEGATREAALLLRLREEGVPTPAPLPRRDGLLLGTLVGKPAAVFPWTEGTIRCQASVAESDLEAVGEALARIHRASPRLPQPRGRFGVPELRERLVRIEGARDPELAREAKPLSRLLDGIENEVRTTRGTTGLVHGDLFRDNVLWRTQSSAQDSVASDTLAALLDFESASHGVFAYDLMVTVLAWCFGDAFEPKLARALVRGYERVRLLDESDRAALHAHGRMAAIRFMITRITDYAMREGIGERVVKDWRRFRMRLETLDSLGAEGLGLALFANTP